MYKIYLSLLFVILSFFVYSQPVVTSSNFPTHGKSLNYYMGNTSIEVNKDGGEDQQWDFSKMTLTDVHGIKYVNSTNTKFFSDFPSSTIAFGPDGSDEFTYLKITDKGIEYLGFGAANGELPFICKYDNPWIMYSLPMHFRDGFQDSFSFTSVMVENGDTTYGFFKGEYKYTVDGYGTLITPQNTYPNTLRVHSVTTGRDSSVRNGKVDTTVVSTFITHKYTWISSDKGNVFEEACTFDFKDFFFQDNENTSSGIISNNTSTGKMVLYPDPANTYVNLEISGFEPGQVSVFLYNSFGSFLKEYKLNFSLPGFFKWQMPLNDLMPGLYSVHIVNKTNEWNAKFIKQ